MKLNIKKDIKNRKNFIKYKNKVYKLNLTYDEKLILFILVENSIIINGEHISDMGKIDLFKKLLEKLK